MDTTTVLAIIEMIDNKLRSIATDYEHGFIRDKEFFSASNALTELQNKLQNYIESQVSAVKNNIDAE